MGWNEDLLPLGRGTLHKLISLRNYELLFVIERRPARLDTTVEHLMLATAHVLAHSTGAHLLRIQIFETLDLVDFESIGTLCAWTVGGAHALLLLLHVEVEIGILDVAHIGRLLMTAEKVTPVGLLAYGTSAIATDLAPFGLRVPTCQRYVQGTSSHIAVFHFGITIL